MKESRGTVNRDPLILQGLSGWYEHDFSYIPSRAISACSFTPSSVGALVAPHFDS
jgi:hypothetical protein